MQDLLHVQKTLEVLADHSLIISKGGHSHKSADADIFVHLLPGNNICQFLLRKPLFGFVSGNEAFQKHVYDLSVDSAPIVYCLKKSYRVNRLHQRYIREDHLQFVGLKMADEMPFHVSHIVRLPSLKTYFFESADLRQKFLWADDLSSYDSIVDFGFNIPLLGDHLSLFALLMAVTMFFYSKMTSAQMSDDPNMAGMKFMSVWLMPIMMFFICNNLSSALSYYYLLSNIITMGITWYIRKFVVTEDKVRAEMMLKANQPKKKSKWQQRLEEAQKMQEQMQKQQRRK